MIPAMLERETIETALVAIKFSADPSSSVLICGRVMGPLVKALALQAPFTAGIVFDREAFNEAREVCHTVEILDLDSTALPERIAADNFDLVVFDGALEYLSHSSEILRSTGMTLRRFGSVVATIPNLAHGAIRLALLNGALDKEYVGVSGGREAEELFKTAGFEVAAACRLVAPVFGDSDDLPRVERSHVSKRTMKAIES